MSLVLSVASRGDADRIAEIHMAAFGSNTMLHAQFPTPAVRHALQNSIREKTLADIGNLKITVLVVRDLHRAERGAQCESGCCLGSSEAEGGVTEPRAEGRVIAFAKWAHPVAVDDEYTEPPWTWPEGTDWDVLARWTKKTEEAQENAVGQTPCYRLHFIGTDPLHGRRGAGSLMVEWGKRQFRKDCAPAYLESTVEAAPFYKKHGFSAMETFSLELDTVKGKSEPNFYEEVSFLFTLQFECFSHLGE